MYDDRGIASSVRSNRKRILQSILVIRFSSLGDLCLLGWSLSRYTAQTETGGCRVVLTTKSAFAPLMSMMQGVDEVISLERNDAQGLWKLARQLKTQPWDLVLDAHGVLRSRSLTFLMGQSPHAIIRKDTTRRLALLRGRSDSILDQRTMHRRFDEVFGFEKPAPIGQVPPPLGHLRQAGNHPRILGVAPGAQWDTKRWPQEHFATLLQTFRTEHDLPIRIFLGPREDVWFAGSALARTCADLPDIQVIRNTSLPEVATLLAACSVLLTNDSGLLHLAEATGTPVLAFFGPTVRQFGYFPLLGASHVMEIDLDCRPCSRNGKRPCHRQDLACLQRITPETVFFQLKRILTS